MAPLILSLTGCTYRSRVKVTVPVTHEKKGESVRLCEAKWSDIPLPLGIVPDIQQTQEAVDGSGCMFVYTTSLSPAECVDFYKREMERLGWREDLLLSFKPLTYFIVYQKPTHLAGLMIETVSNTTRVQLQSGFKKSTLEQENS